MMSRPFISIRRVHQLLKLMKMHKLNQMQSPKRLVSLIQKLKQPSNLLSRKLQQKLLKLPQLKNLLLIFKRLLRLESTKNLK